MNEIKQYAIMIGQKGYIINEYADVDSFVYNKNNRPTKKELFVEDYQYLQNNTHFDS